MVEVLEPYNIALIRMQEDLPFILQRIFTEKSEIIVNLLFEQQLSVGLDGDGREIGRYSRYTELIARYELPRPIKPKEAGELYNFEWTGDWKSKMKAIFSNEREYEILSSDGKHKELIVKYGDEIVKPSVDLNAFINKNILKPGLYQEFVNRLNNATK